MEITNEKYQELVEAKATLDLLCKLYAGLQSYQFDDVCKIILVKQEAKDAEEHRIFAGTCRTIPGTCNYAIY